MRVLSSITIVLFFHCTSAQIGSNPECKVNYKEDVDMTYAPHVVITAAIDVRQCRATCEADLDCIGFDFTLATKACYIVNTLAATSGVETGTNHYTRSTVCPHPFSAERCFFLYLGQYDFTDPTQRTGPVRGVNRTLSDCTSLCAVITTCTSIVYNLTGRTCLISFETTSPVVADLTVTPNSIMYTTDSTLQCAAVPIDGNCTDSYIVVPGISTSNGTYISSNNTMKACEAFCNVTAACLGYDFHSTDTECYLHFTPTGIPSNRIEVNGYRKSKECTTTDVCTYSWNGAYTAKDTVLFTSTPNIITVSECFAACNALPSCTGISFNSLLNSVCKLYSVSTALDRLELITTTDGTTSYKRTQCAATTTIAPTPVPGSCAANLYRIMAGRKVTGATRTQTDPAGQLTACQAACNADFTCWAADYNTADNSCYLHTSDVRYAPSIPGLPSETHFEKYYLCASCEYNIYPNVNNPSIRSQQIYNTLDTCLQACSATAACLGADYDTALNICYFLNTPRNSANVVTNNLFRQYIKPVSCPGPTSTGCNFNRFTSYPGRKISGGIPSATSPATDATCEANCISDAQCIGYDTNSAKACFLLKIYSPITDGASGENHWHREPECNINGQQACRYFDAGTSVPATGSSNPIVVTSRQACFERCSDTFCSGLSYDSVTGLCQTYGQTANWADDALQISNNANLEAYKFNGCETTVTTPTTSVTATATATATATGSTAPGGCVGGTWLPFANTNVQGGVPNDMKTQDECRRSCIENSNCLAIDFDTVRTPECYLHLNAMFLATRQQLDGVTHEVLTRCTDTTPSSSSTVSPTTCIDEYRMRPNHQVHGGSLVPDDSSVSSAALCMAWCDANVDCFGFDFTKNNQQCWWQNKYGPIVPSTDTSDHYLKVANCGGCSFDRYPGKRVNQILGNTVSRDTAMACLELCRSETTCKSADYNAATRECTWFISEHTTTLIDASSSLNQVHFEKGQCDIQTTCIAVVKYDREDGKQIIGGQRAGNANTVAECEIECGRNCAGFDFDGGCWLTPTHSRVELSPRDGVAHYTKYYDCGGCRYDVFGDSTVSGSSGQLQSSVLTLFDCISACSASSTCRSMEFNKVTSNRCYHFTDLFDQPSQLTGTSEYNHLVKRCTTTGESTTGSSIGSTSPTGPSQGTCSVTFREMAGQKWAAGTSTSDDSPSTCRTRCEIDGTCIAYDYNSIGPSNQRCWIHTSSDNTLVAQNDRESVTHYTKQWICGACSYEPHTDSRMSVSTAVNGPTTEQACVARCSASSGCLQASFTGGNCFQSRDAGRQPTRNVKTWTMVGTCAGATQPSTITTTVVTVTTPPTPATLPPEALCVETFIAYANQHVSGGTREVGSGPYTNATCLLRCRAATDCSGYDLTTGGQCWLTIASQAQRNEITPDSSGTIHYRKIKNCNNVCYRIVYGHSFGTSSSQGNLDRDTCLLGCTQNNCVDVIYDTRNSDPCRYVSPTFTNVDPTILIPAVGSTYYSRLASCGNEAQQLRAGGTRTTRSIVV